MSKTTDAVEALAAALELSPKQLNDLADFLWDDAEMWRGTAGMRDDAHGSAVVSELCRALAKVVAR